ncbi:MAG: hypothetical protein ABJH04_08135 [Cyclobacteriaceae bacterium]
MACSINQFNGFVRTNQTIQFYNWFRDNCRWRNKYYMTSRGREEPIIGNSVYGQIQKLAKIKCGLDLWNNPTTYTHLIVDSLHIPGYELRIDLRAAIDAFKGAYVVVTIDKLRDGDYRKFCKSFTIRSSQAWKDFDVHRYVRDRVLGYFLFPEGKYRDLQIILGKSKEETIREMKMTLNSARQKEDIELFPILKRRLRKKLNIVIDEFSYINEERLLGLLKKYKKRFRVPTEVRPAPNVWEILDGMEGDVDEVESLYYETMSEYPKNCILI